LEGWDYIPIVRRQPAADSGGERKSGDDGFEADVAMRGFVD